MCSLTRRVRCSSFVDVPTRLFDITNRFLECCARILNPSAALAARRPARPARAHIGLPPTRDGRTPAHTAHAGVLCVSIVTQSKTSCVASHKQRVEQVRTLIHIHPSCHDVPDVAHSQRR